jgi:hypothetical protein
LNKVVSKEKTTDTIKILCKLLTQKFIDHHDFHINDFGNFATVIYKNNKLFNLNSKNDKMFYIKLYQDRGFGELIKRNINNFMKG